MAVYTDQVNDDLYKGTGNLLGRILTKSARGGSGQGGRQIKWKVLPVLRDLPQFRRERELKSSSNLLIAAKESDNINVVD
jgi:hypothetical protein